MDGTLVDTEPAWVAAETALAHRHGAEWTEADGLSLVGNSLLTSAGYIRERMGLDLTPEEIVEELLDGVVASVRESVPWRPGARELLEELHARGVPCALVTMSYERLVAPILGHLPADTFDVVITGDKVSYGKPHPEPYLSAAAALGLDPADCVAIEDSSTGATSAEAAGCTVLVVQNHVAVPPGPRRVFRDSLTELDGPALARLQSELG
ncbi:HAD family phosphatase [Nocardioides sp. zg-DK7169]|nr:HAD family phosphatase [Nocardioides sp. zg-DK7169]